MSRSRILSEAVRVNHCIFSENTRVTPRAAALSPVPGGVGPMTVTMLLVNTVVAWCRRHGNDHGLEDLIG